MPPANRMLYTFKWKINCAQHDSCEIAAVFGLIYTITCTVYIYT